MTSGTIAKREPFFRRLINRHFRIGLAFVVMLVLLTINASLNPRFFSPPSITSTANQSMTLVFAGMAQTSVVLTGGIDLSNGSIIGLTNSLASSLFTTSVPGGIAVIVLVLVAGILCGLINGSIVVYGRLQPLIVTLATASVYDGIALYIRPTPGGFVPDWYSTALTQRIFGVLPASLVLLVLVILIVWTPFRRSQLGMWVYAVGSNEDAAYISGINTNRAKLAAYGLGGLLAAIAGLFLTAQTQSGNANSLFAGLFTLRSIAVVVMGGTLLIGGSGGIAGTIAGAFSLRMISGILFFANVNPLQQTFWEGAILLFAVIAGGGRVFSIKNRLDAWR